jgi:hypothetical protein
VALGNNYVEAESSKGCRVIFSASQALGEIGFRCSMNAGRNPRPRTQRVTKINGPPAIGGGGVLDFIVKRRPQEQAAMLDWVTPASSKISRPFFGFTSSLSLQAA